MKKAQPFEPFLWQVHQRTNHVAQRSSKSDRFIYLNVILFRCPPKVCVLCCKMSILKNPFKEPMEHKLEKLARPNSVVTNRLSNIEFVSL